MFYQLCSTLLISDSTSDSIVPCVCGSVADDADGWEELSKDVQGLVAFSRFPLCEKHISSSNHIFFSHHLYNICSSRVFHSLHLPVSKVSSRKPPKRMWWTLTCLIRVRSPPLAMGSGGFHCATTFALLWFNWLFFWQWLYYIVLASIGQFWPSHLVICLKDFIIKDSPDRRSRCKSEQNLERVLNQSWTIAAVSRAWHLPCIFLAILLGHTWTLSEPWHLHAILVWTRSRCPLLLIAYIICLDVNLSIESIKQ